LRAMRERLGQPVSDTREVNPGEVWEENEFWIDLTWRIDPDGDLGIRQYVESKREPGTKLGIDEYYAYAFEHSVPGLAAAAAAENLTPLEYMRRYGAFEIQSGMDPVYQQPVPAAELEDVHENPLGRVFTRAPKPASPNIVPQAGPEGDDEGRRPVGVTVDGKILRGFPTPSGKLEFYSSTLAEWGWPEYAMPTYIKSHIHRDRIDRDQMVLISTFRLPVHIHTRSANAKWLTEIAHSNPLWINPVDAGRMAVRTGDLLRVETEIGYFVVKAWVTEGIRPDVVACSHHMGRWKLHDSHQGPATATASLEHHGSSWHLGRTHGAGPYESDDADSSRIWWTDVGVHQNLTFPVHPDPISGQHCWHQAVRVRKAQPDDRYGDVSVDGAKSRAVYLDWLAKARPADRHSPDGTRRPFWLMRPLKPPKEVFRIPEGILNNGCHE
ncbi:MAG: molybdopterin dinucleotide binding domain-containing protein, partial [Gemmatimonadales bacterium]